MNCFQPDRDGPAPRFPGSTLIVPAISIGNVPQLCCDLVISTLRLERVGFLNDPNVTPFVGPKAYDHARSNLSTALEVFQCSTGKFTVIQQRAPILRKQQRAFVENLAQFITDGSFTRVVLLSTIDATLRDDRQLTEGSSAPFQYLPTTAASAGFLALFDQLQIPRLDGDITKDYSPWFRSRSRGQGRKPPSPETTPGSSNLAQDYSQLSLHDQAKPTHRMWTPHIPGGGIAHQLHQVCERLQLPLVVLLEFVAEGDNIPESILMANGLHSLLGLLSPTGELGSQEWVPPGSWHSFYSTRVPQMLYY
ncbi:hypothetical protein H4R33_006231 [Dimargaris cristalligena]|nr:hypothetical protein H4R33_006231 [Dimargaris cristalligena]